MRTRAALLAAALLAALAPLFAAGAERTARVAAVECIGVTVSDLDRAVAFYSGVLAFARVAESEAAGPEPEALTGVFALRTRTARLRLGEECLELTEYLGPKGRPIPGDARSNDRSFQHVAIVVSDMDRAYARLRAARVEHASAGPQRLPEWNPDAGGIRAFYFRDPDRHVLEVLQFPPGKGDPRWHALAAGRGGTPRARGDDPLFLGIDHTAIVVADTHASVRFYRDVLGLRVAGGSENLGVEQARLNGVEGAHLRITTLRAARGPGVELLEYLAPRDGQPYPRDARPNDLVHWQTTLVSPALDESAAAVRASGATFLSRRAAELGGSPNSRRGVLVRDPDGHALLLAEPPPAIASRAPRSASGATTKGIAPAVPRGPSAAAPAARYHPRRVTR